MPLRPSRYGHSGSPARPPLAWSCGTFTQPAFTRRVAHRQQRSFSDPCAATHACPGCMPCQQGELGISPGADLVKVVKAFPEVLSCSIEELLRPNVARFEKEWFMKGPVLAKAIVRKPTLLGLYVDCSTVGSGSCMGQCSKCWSAN
eukprot:365052-Chlamydomonas_euryale.AAC.21